MHINTENAMAKIKRNGQKNLFINFNFVVWLILYFVFVSPCQPISFSLLLSVFLSRCLSQAHTHEKALVIVNTFLTTFTMAKLKSSMRWIKQGMNEKRIPNGKRHKVRTKKANRQSKEKQDVQHERKREKRATKKKGEHGLKE